MMLQKRTRHNFREFNFHFYTSTIKRPWPMKMSTKMKLKKRRNYPIDNRELFPPPPRLPVQPGLAYRLGRSIFRCILSTLAVPFVIVWALVLCLIYFTVLVINSSWNISLTLDQDQYPPPHVFLPFTGLSLLLPILNLIDFFRIFLNLDNSWKCPLSRLI